MEVDNLSDVYEKIIIGGGFYGLYSSLVCGKAGQRVLLIETESEPFKKATYINQARVHMGYHYPRSISTALKSKKYFDKFNNDFPKCVEKSFDQIYAVSNDFSWTNGKQFQKFCNDAGIYCRAIHTEQYFKPKLCDAAFLTQEYAYDASILKEKLLGDIKACPNVTMKFGTKIASIENNGEQFVINAASRGGG
ncbi:hypothetical protein FACS189494_11990 [Spirochaetia bacterium]|nr:hypothetical protein FACS189494_11990 [Spirochaetia bacterium]